MVEYIQRIEYYMPVGFKGALPLLTLLIVMLPVVPVDFSVTTTNRVCNTLAVYTIQTSRAQSFAVENGSTFMVSFPSEYNAVVLKTYSYSISGVVCQGPCNLTVSLSGNSFLVSGLFSFDLSAGDMWDVLFTISSVMNPNTQSPGSFTVTIFKGSVIFYSRTGPTFVSSSTFSLQTVSFTTQVLYPTIWAVSPVRFTITPNFAIDTIRIQFPSKWSLFMSSTDGAVASNSTCRSTTNPTAICGVSGSLFNLTNLYYYTAGVPIDMIVSSINNPSSAIPAGAITVELLLNTVPVQRTTSYSLPASSFTSDTHRKTSSSWGNQTGEVLQVLLNFQFANINTNTDRIYVTFPGELTMPSTAASYTILAPTLVSSLNFVGNDTVMFNVTGNQGKTAVSMTINNLARPRECKNISNFAIKTYRNNLYLMESTSCCSLQLANRQTLLINSIVPSTNLQGRVATYKFTFTTSSISILNLATTDSIQIVFPPEYSDYITAANSSTLCDALNITATNNPALIKTPTCSIGLNTVLLSSFLTGALPGAERFEVNMGGVTNPSSPLTTGFSISTLSAANYVLEQALNYTIPIQASTLTYFSVDASPKQTCAIAVYTFSLGNSPLFNGYSIFVNFPADITNADFNSMECKINGVNFPCSRKNSTFGSNTIIVLVSINAPVPVNTSLTISSITNPISLATTASFSASILDASGVVI
jgi:hypothetical protein